MRDLTTKTLLALSFIIIFGACKKDSNSSGGSDPVPATPPLSRDLSLKYNGTSDDSQESFGTLKEDANPTIFNWAGGKANPKIIHFGLGVDLGQLAFYAPHDVNAKDIFLGLPGFNGIPFWLQPLKGLTFDSGAAPNVDFANLTKESIDANVPDVGFGGSNATKIQIQQGKIIRFIFRDSNDVLKYKGYMSITAAVNGNPKTASVTVKYIAK